MKKQPRKILAFWIFVAAVAAAGTFLICEHLGIGTVPGAAIGTELSQSTANAQPDMDADASVGQDGSPNATAATAVPMQEFSNGGYEVSIPASWSIERIASDTVAIHADASSSPDAGCKLEVSAFPFVGGTDVAGWIGGRIGADPSLSIAERSSEDVSVSGGTGVKWIGTIDGLPTTLVYLFGASHAYEIAPSFVGVNDAASAGSGAQCDDMLETFLSTIKI